MNERLQTFFDEVLPDVKESLVPGLYVDFSLKIENGYINNWSITKKRKRSKKNKKKIVSQEMR